MTISLAFDAGFPNGAGHLAEVCSELRAGAVLESPGHTGGVMGKADAAIRAEQDDAAVTAEALVEVIDGGGRGNLRRGAGSDAVDGPFAEDELHDGLAPAGERDGSGEIVGVATAADEGGVTDAAGGF